jgi:DNA-binding IclR family transcriptional regulator
MESTGETAILSMRFGNVAAWVEMIESRHPVRLALRVGERLQLHAGASSKVLWAFLPSAEIEALMAQVELAPLERNTITSPEQMRRELATIREQGYATSFEETDRGAMGIAAPVYDHTGRAVAGIGIAAPVTRIPPEEAPGIARHVLVAGRALSQRLGAPKITNHHSLSSGGNP